VDINIILKALKTNFTKYFSMGKAKPCPFFGFLKWGKALPDPY
jgi:hypothetical protein